MDEVIAVFKDPPDIVDLISLHVRDLREELGLRAAPMIKNS